MTGGPVPSGGASPGAAAPGAGATVGGGAASGGGAAAGAACTASAAGLHLLAHHGLAGRGDGMQVIREGDAVYVGHTGTTGAGTSVLDAAETGPVSGAP